MTLQKLSSAETLKINLYNYICAYTKAALSGGLSDSALIVFGLHSEPTPPGKPGFVHFSKEPLGGMLLFTLGIEAEKYKFAEVVAYQMSIFLSTLAPEDLSQASSRHNKERPEALLFLVEIILRTFHLQKRQRLLFSRPLRRPSHQSCQPSPRLVKHQHR